MSPPPPAPEPAVPVPSDPSGPRRLRRRILLAARFAMAGLLLWFLFRRVSVGDVVGVADGIGPAVVAAMLAIVFASHALLAFRLGLLVRLQGLALSNARVLAINLGAGFYSLFVPGGNVAASAVRILRLAHPHRRYAAAVSAIVFDRVHATLSLFVIGAAFWLLDSSHAQRLPGGLLVGGLGVCVVAVPALAAAARRLSRVERHPGRLLAVAERLQRLGAALDTYRSAGPWPWIAASALSLVVHLVGIVGFHLLAGAFGLEMSFVTMAWVRSFVFIVTMLPISVGGLGVREVAFVYALAPMDIAEPAILAFSLAVFGFYLLIPGIAGAVVETVSLLGGKPSGREPAAGAMEAAPAAGKRSN